MMMVMVIVIIIIIIMVSLMSLFSLCCFVSQFLTEVTIVNKYLFFLPKNSISN